MEVLAGVATVIALGGCCGEVGEAAVVVGVDTACRVDPPVGACGE